MNRAINYWSVIVLGLLSTAACQHREMCGRKPVAHSSSALGTWRAVVFEVNCHATTRPFTETALERDSGEPGSKRFHSIYIVGYTQNVTVDWVSADTLILHSDDVERTHAAAETFGEVTVLYRFPQVDRVDSAHAAPQAYTRGRLRFAAHFVGQHAPTGFSGDVEGFLRRRGLWRYESQLLDAWMQLPTVRSEGDSTIASSKGPDGVAGNADDIIVVTERPSLPAE